MTARIPGRALAWFTLAATLVISIAANVAYARPTLGPRLSAGTAPVLVVLAAGLLERVELAGSRWWQRWLAVGGLVLVVLTAFITSYQHQYELLIVYGNPQLSAVLLPFAVDALIVMSSVCLAVIADQRRRVAEFASDPEPKSEPLSLLLVGDDSEQPADDEPARPATPKRQPSARDRVVAFARRHPTATPAQIAARLEISERTVQRHLRSKADDSVSPAPAPA